MRCLIILLMLCISVCEGRTQVFETVHGEGGLVNGCNATENVVVADGFGKNWFVQMGLDMTLQNPYGYDFSEVFPNGKSFGLELAVGKWFSHQIGVRGKFNWENKLPLLKNDHANWLAPFYQPGVNREKGGYVVTYCDVLMNLHNLFGAYRADRTWNMSVYPRFGINYNFGVSKGALALGIGILNTYRLNERWSVYGDMAYVMTGSGFVGTENVEGTGTGSNSNGYLTIGLGMQYDLGKKKTNTNYTNNSGPAEKKERTERGVLTNGIWDNWFVQAQFVEGSASPLAGGGIEETYRLKDNLSLFGAFGYQVSTSEGLGYGHTGMDVAAGTNGFFDIDFGVRLDLGRKRFCRAN